MVTVEKYNDSPMAAAWDRHSDREDARRAQRIAHIRATCLEACASELEPHRSNVDKARAAVDQLVAQADEPTAAATEAQAVKDLASATAAGDAQAALAAATTLQALRNGTHPSALEALQVAARLDKARADLVSAQASLKKAEQAALGARLAALEKDVERAVKAYEQVAQTVFDRYYLLKEVSKEHMRFAAALVGADLSVNFTALERGPSQIELPVVSGVPGHPIVRAIGRRQK